MLILKTNMTKQEINMAVLENSRRRRAAVKIVEYIKARRMWQKRRAATCGKRKRKGRKK